MYDKGTLVLIWDSFGIAVTNKDKKLFVKILNPPKKYVIISIYLALFQSIDTKRSARSTCCNV